MPAICAVIAIAILFTIAPVLSVIPMMVWAMCVLPLTLSIVDFSHAHGIRGTFIDGLPIYLTWMIAASVVVFLAWRWYRERRALDFTLLVLAIGLPATEMWGLKLVGHTFAG